MMPSTFLGKQLGSYAEKAAMAPTRKKPMVTFKLPQKPDSTQKPNQDIFKYSSQPPLAKEPLN